MFFVLIGRQVYYATYMYMYVFHSADCNYSESSEINMSYFVLFFSQIYYVCLLCVFLCVFHHIASILYLIVYIIMQFKGFKLSLTSTWTKYYNRLLYEV